ncbi:FtsK/SpoIIIE domain-containing protein [Phycicoccus sp. Root101]|uniref:FtsK/SpoIIIE domain-containing protein n=1 Tax=Phycicoccus sp. Root101 TaxID=1736421 RepID=UPI0007032A8A|nr:FtsK/SpoIIIE domain-containing protein [Phycicoccus sp. Root101]KQU69491.1 hypothetical protein ASC58_06340 [Phycicoccus sp. Root101]
MHLRLTVTHRAPGASAGFATVEVEVDAVTGSTAADLVDALVDHLAPRAATTAEPPSLAVAGRVVAPGAVVGQPPLLDGAEVTLQPPHLLQDNGSRRPSRSTVVLAITHGPECGRTLDLQPGRHTLGRSTEATIEIADPSLSRLHTEIRVDASGVTLRDLGSTNGSRVDGTLVGDQPVPVTTASVIHLGDTVVALRHTGAVPASTRATGEGTVAVNRRPRVVDPAPTPTIALPTPPPPPRRARVPWVAVLLPVPVAGVLAVVVGPTMLAFALMGPVLMVGTALSDRWGARRTYAGERAAHDAALRVVRERIEATCRTEASTLHCTFPDPATILGIASGPTERIWERRRGDDDAWTVAVGRCGRDASLRLTSGGEPAGDLVQPHLRDVPCVVSLVDVGVLGLCGQRAAVLASARSLVGQLVTMHSPSDLEVVILADTPERATWEWVTRIPHCHNSSRRGGSPDNTDTTLADLAATVRLRRADRRPGRWDGPTTVVVVDAMVGARELTDLATVLADGPRAGVLTLALGSDLRELPNEAGAVLELSGNGAPTLSLTDHRHHDLVVDGVGPGWPHRLARSLAPLRDATPADGRAALPTNVGLLARDRPAGEDGADLARRWHDHPHRTRVPIGASSSGVFSIDLAADGPHVLVGGTTGAGKSELLRTLVASLALHNAPQHLSFVLVDYKGGAAFRECADLPHVSGVVTDLDDQLAARALTSLTAEVTRRERILRAAGVADLVAYQASPAGAALPLARLVVVVDEFRALADELPAFVDGLVHLAALGRSLGIHLVLATQRPAGVVTADIKANVNLRIALRMRDRLDSEDVVDSPAAAALPPSTPGRAYARVGGSGLVEFQSAHVGALVPQPRATPVRVRAWSADPPAQPRTGPATRTELGVIVDTVRQATAAGGFVAASPAWLPPLPVELPHADLDATDDPFTAHLGLVDVPERQSREMLAFDLRARGHWAVVGGPGSGRTTALLTHAVACCNQRDAASLHVYALGGGLAALSALPQVGAVVDWTDPRRVERLVSRLATEVAERRAALARGDGTALPPMLLLVDDWDLVAGRTDDLALSTLTDQLLALLQDGQGVGLTAVVAGGRSLLLGRVAGTVTRRVVLRLADPTDAVLLGMPPGRVAALTCPGRGLTMEGNEVQLALPPEPRNEEGPPTTSPPTTDLPGRSPLRVDELPLEVHEEELRPHPDRPPYPAGIVPVGIGGDESTVLGLDPRQDGRRWLVTGPAASGVSSALLLLARRHLAAGRPVAVVAPRGGPLEVLRAEPAVLSWSDGTDGGGLVEARRRAPSLVVLADDVDALLDQPVEAVLREVSHLADRDQGLLVVGAAASTLSSMYRGAALEVARHRTGLLLGPASSAEADLFGLRVPVDRRARPGRGHLVRRGSASPVQVARPGTGAVDGPAAAPLAGPGAPG